MWKKTIGLVLCLAVLSLPMMNVCAVNDELEVTDSVEVSAPLQDSASTPGSSEGTLKLVYTNSIYTNLAIVSGNATCIAGFTGYPGITNKVEISMYLQKRFLIFWLTEDNWSQTYYNYSATMSHQTGVSGGTYRVKAIYIAFSGAESETVTGYSSTVTY